MKRILSAFAVLVLLAFLATGCGTGIPEKVGNWRVEVGPPGNEFYQPPAAAPGASPPSDELMALVARIAPANSEIEGWELLEENLYAIRAETEQEEYDFEVRAGGQIVELQYENDLADVKEQPGTVILTGTKQPLSTDKLPEQVRVALEKAFPGEELSESWQVETAAGSRFAIALGTLGIYARPDGQIQAIGLLSKGALNEIPSAEELEEAPAKVLAKAEKLLAPHRDRFNVQKQIAAIGSGPASGGFRFVVMGDSRSNPDLWPTIIKHISQIDPQPVFVINTGDLIRRGYSEEYKEYFIPPLEEYKIPFFVALGNHDKGDNGKAIEYQYLFGQNSLNYFFDYGGIRFVLVDNVTSVLTTEETIQWLEGVFAQTDKTQKKLVFTHMPISTVEKWAYHAWNEAGSKRFEELMTENKVDHVFFGHIHAYSTAVRNGIPYTICGGGGAGLHDRFGEMGNVHHYIICDVQKDGTIKQQVLRFYNESQAEAKAE